MNMLMIRMRLLDAVQLGGQLRPVGSIVDLGMDSARQLFHQQRAVPIGAADRARLNDFPIITRY
jgi:hypothetical protein